MRRLREHFAKRGDTIIEVSFAVAMFALVSVMSIGIMNAGIASAQSTLEVTMARNEMDAQAEAIRYIHNAFLSEIELVKSKRIYNNLWHYIGYNANPSEGDTFVGLANDPNDDSLSTFEVSSCSDVYEGTNSTPTIADNNAFILNTRNIDPTNPLSTVKVASKDAGAFGQSTLYPRVIYKNDDNLYNGTDTSEKLNEIGDTINKSNAAKYRHDHPVDEITRAEGIWIISIKEGDHENPEYLDFHIRTCWYAPNSTSTPSTIGTIVRLYNPEFEPNPEYTGGGSEEGEDTTDEGEDVSGGGSDEEDDDGN